MTFKIYWGSKKANLWEKNKILDGCIYLCDVDTNQTSSVQQNIGFLRFWNEIIKHLGNIKSSHTSHLFINPELDWNVQSCISVCVCVCTHGYLWMGVWCIPEVVEQGMWERQVKTLFQCHANTTHYDSFYVNFPFWFPGQAIIASCFSLQFSQLDPIPSGFHFQNIPCSNAHTALVVSLPGSKATPSMSL